MNNWMITTAEFLVTYWIHSSVFVGAALIAIQFNWLGTDKKAEWLTKAAMIIGIVTSLLVLSNGKANLKTTEQVTVGDAAQRIQGESQSLAPKVKRNEFLARQDEQPINQNKVLGPNNKLNPNPSASTEGSSGINQRFNIALNQMLDAEKFAPWLSLFWIFGILILAANKVYQRLLLKRLLQCREEVVDENLLLTFKALLEKSGMPTNLKLSQSRNIQSPLVCSSREVIIQAGFAKDLTQEQRVAALSHEIAHLKRKDTLWLKLAQFIEVLLFVQPLNNVLGKHIHQLAEQRSDQLAAKWTGNPRALVEALSVVAHNNFYSSQTKMVFAMKSKKSNLIKRIEGLLKGKTKSTGNVPVLLGGLLTTLVVVIAPGLTIQTAFAASVSTVESVTPAKPLTRSKNDEIHKLNSSYIDDGEKYRVRGKIKGKVIFNDSETAIMVFPKHSELAIEIERDGIDRKIEIERGSGQVEYTYYEGGDEKPYDASAQEWFASVIPTILRITGFNAEERVARIKNKSGDSGVLDEVELIRSDYVSGLYLRILFNQSKLSEKSTLRAIELIKDIDSDYEQANVLKSLVANQELKVTKLWTATLAATTKIGSDYEQAGVLKDVIPLLPKNNDIQQKYFEVASDIGSDYEMRLVFSSFIKKQQFGDIGLIAMFDAAENIGSDFELSSLLIEASNRIESSPEVFSAYIKLAETIGSDFEMRRAYSNLLKTKLNKPYLIKMIESASDEIGSDHELSYLLVQTIESGQIDAEVASVIRVAANSIDSKFERLTVLEKLIDNS